MSEDRVRYGNAVDDAAGASSAWSSGMRPPVEWDRLPDIGLYMDQVLTYLARELGAHSRGKADPEDGTCAASESMPTASMINNYAKAQVIPRAEGKKYSRDHIALLLSAFALKRVLSVQEMAELLGGLGGHERTREFYELFRSSMAQAADEATKAVSEGLGGRDRSLGAGTGPGSEAERESGFRRRELLETALRLAVDASMRSYASGLLLRAALSCGEKKPTASRSSKK